MRDANEIPVIAPRKFTAERLTLPHAVVAETVSGRSRAVTKFAAVAYTSLLKILCRAQTAVRATVKTRTCRQDARRGTHWSADPISNDVSVPVRLLSAWRERGGKTRSCSHKSLSPIFQLHIVFLLVNPSLSVHGKSRKNRRETPLYAWL